MLLLFPGASFGAVGATFLRAEQSARMVGLGGAFAPRADDGDAVYWNPAGLGFQSGSSATLTHYQGFVDLKQEFLNAVHPISGFGTVGLDALYSSVGNVQLYDDLGLDTGSIENHDLALEASWGRAWKRRFALGAGIKYFNSRLAEAVASGLALDLGALVRPVLDKDVLVGGSLQNLGPGLKYIAVSDPLPLNLKIGISSRFSLKGAHKILGSLEISRILYKYELTYLNMGLEYVYGGLLSLRAGYRMNRATDHFSLGAGLCLKPVRADYSFVPFATLGGTHRISLGYDFLAGKAEPIPSPEPSPTATEVATASPPSEASPAALPPAQAPASLSGPASIIQIPYSYAFRIPGDLLFQAGSALLKPEANATLTQAAKLILGNYPEATVLIVGHTDNLPVNSASGLASNFELSLVRARGVADLMIHEGLDPSRVRVQGAGETKPAASNDSEEGRAANRRVEVQVKGEKSYGTGELLLEASRLSALRDWNGALRLLVPGVRILPDNPALLRLLGSALVQSGDSARGLPFLKRSLELNPGDAELRDWLEKLEAH